MCLWCLEVMRSLFGVCSGVWCCSLVFYFFGSVPLHLILPVYLIFLFFYSFSFLLFILHLFPYGSLCVGVPLPLLSLLPLYHLILLLLFLFILLLVHLFHLTKFGVVLFLSFPSTPFYIFSFSSFDKAVKMELLYNCFSFLNFLPIFSIFLSPFFSPHSLSIHLSLCVFVPIYHVWCLRYYVLSSYFGLVQ